jgi:putative SOS response-associated peptidase YedK
MCSQFEIKMPLEKLMKTTQFLFDEVDISIQWDLHVYPYMKSPVIAHFDTTNKLQLMSYSLVPSWSKVPKPKFATYNARLDRPNKETIEYIFNAPTWRTPFKNHHCIVPITSFFESCRQGTHMGNIVKFSADSPILFVAGLWDKWVNPITNDIIYSFATITDNPCEFILNVGHDRQPVFLNDDNAMKWLNNQFNSVQMAYSFLKNHQEPINYNVENFKKLKGYQDDLFS